MSTVGTQAGIHLFLFRLQIEGTDQVTLSSICTVGGIHAMHLRYMFANRLSIYVMYRGVSLYFFCLFPSVSKSKTQWVRLFAGLFTFLKKSHSICPFHRILTCWRFILSRNLFIQNAPEDPRDLFVRPEVRAMSKGPMEMKLRCLETYAPGDALMERTNCMWIIRLAAETWQR